MIGTADHTPDVLQQSSNNICNAGTSVVRIIVLLFYEQRLRYKMSISFRDVKYL